MLYQKFIIIPKRNQGSFNLLLNSRYITSNYSIDYNNFISYTVCCRYKEVKGTLVPSEIRRIVLHMVQSKFVDMFDVLYMVTHDHDHYRHDHYRHYRHSQNRQSINSQRTP